MVLILILEETNGFNPSFIHHILPSSVILNNRTDCPGNVASILGMAAPCE